MAYNFVLNINPRVILFTYLLFCLFYFFLTVLLHFTENVLKNLFNTCTKIKQLLFCSDFNRVDLSTPRKVAEVCLSIHHRILSTFHFTNSQLIYQHLHFIPS